MSPEESAGPVVKIHVALTFEEYRKTCNRVRAKYQVHPVLSHVVGAVLLLIFWHNMLEGGDIMQLLTCWILGAWITLLWLQSVTIQITGARRFRKRWKLAADLLEPLTYTFSPAGVQTANPNATTTMSWKLFVGAQKTGPMILLTYFDGFSYILPERAFESPEDRRTFQQLVEAMVPNCRF